MVEAGKWLPANPAKLKANFDEIEVTFGMETALTEDQTVILVGAIREIKPDQYKGVRPPPRSYEPAIRGQEILGFRWKSAFFSGYEMYFKFCLNGAEDGRRAFICSIHEHRDQDD